MYFFSPFAFHHYLLKFLEEGRQSIFFGANSNTTFFFFFWQSASTLDFYFLYLPTRYIYICRY